MPNKPGVKDEIERVREIHAFDVGGVDPDTGEEYGHTGRYFTEWDVEDPNHFLTKLLQRRPNALVSCVEVAYNRSTPLDPVTGKTTAKCVNNVQLPIVSARDWLELGFDSPTLDVSGYVESFFAPLKTKIMNIGADETKVDALLKELAETKERLARLEGVGEGKKETTSSGGKK